MANYTVFQPVAKIKTDPEFGNIQPPTSCYLLPVINFVFSKLEFSLITSGTQVYRGKPSPPTTPPPERLLPRCRREIKLMLTRLLRPHQRLSGNHFFLSQLSSLMGFPRLYWKEILAVKKNLLKVCNFTDYLTDLAVLGASWTPLEGENFSTSWLIWWREMR